QKVEFFSPRRKSLIFLETTCPPILITKSGIAVSGYLILLLKVTSGLQIVAASQTFETGSATITTRWSFEIYLMVSNNLLSGAYCPQTIRIEFAFSHSV